MEIRLSGKNALVIAGITVMEAAIACLALKKAAKAEERANDNALEASIYRFSDYMKELEIKDLKKENAKLKSVLEGKES